MTWSTTSPWRAARRRDVATRVPRPRPEIDQVIGRLDDLAVVLDQNQRVAQVTQMLESAPSSRALSRGCRPIVGSSST